MANTDRVEWRLLDTDLVTQKCILPVSEGHLYFEFQEPGSGEIKIPLDSAAALLVASGMFCMAYYRGAARGGFFVDNIKKVPASESEGEARWMSISGRGSMALLDECIVYPASTGETETTRTFTAQAKGAILHTLIAEGIARGWGTAFSEDFSATQDSNSVSWGDSEDIELNVGQSLLDVLRDFAATGDIEFSMEYVGSTWRLHAYSTQIGTDKSDTVFMRIGYNCIEVSEDERGDEIKNAYLAKFRDGYINSIDSASITARRRREKMLNLDAAQSGDSAQTFASAKLAQTKDPKTSFSIRVSDEVEPYLFVDYELGDTITVDRFGSEVSYRVLGVQVDFTGDNYANVVLELNSLFYDDDLRMNRDLDRLMNQWNTAKDANQLEVKQWMSIGQPNGEVYALHYYDGYLYVGGNFTAITGRLLASYIARYNITTGAWEAMGTTITSPIVAITNRNGEITIATNDAGCKIYIWTGSVWSLIGTGGGSTGANTLIADGSNLYVGLTLVGGTPSINSVSMASRVGKWNGSTWSAIGGSTSTDRCYSLVFFNGNLYGGFTGVVDVDYFFQKWDGAVWSRPFSDNHLSNVTALVVVGDELFFVSGYDEVRRWDGTASTSTLLGTAYLYTGSMFASGKFLASYLHDLIYGGDFSGMEGVAGYNNIARYSGGSWSKLGDGVTPTGSTGYVNAVEVINDDIYVGGKFTTASGQAISNLAVWVTSFDSLVSHLQNDNQFDMAAAIHDASASAITDSDEMGFWEDTSTALRKITWANIKATLKTYFDTLYSSYLYLTNRPTAETNTNNIFRCDSPGGVSAFAGTIATLPGGADLTYNVTSGNEGAMVPQSTSQLAKMRLYNTTRGTSALILNCVTGTNTITLTANVPVGWATTDVITIASQTVTGAPVNYVDLEITSGPTGKSIMAMFMIIISATVGDNMRLHPFEAFGGAKQKTAQATVANLNGINLPPMMKITGNVFSLAWTGTPTNIILTEEGYFE